MTSDNIDRPLSMTHDGGTMETSLPRKRIKTSVPDTIQSEECSGYGQAASTWEQDELQETPTQLYQDSAQSDTQKEEETQDNQDMIAVVPKTPMKTNEELLKDKEVWKLRMKDPLNWEFIPLNSDCAGFGDIPILGLSEWKEQQDILNNRNFVRESDVIALANRMYRYREAAIRYIRRETPKTHPDLYVKQELFAEKIGALAYRVALSSMPIDLMSAKRLKTLLNLDNDDLAKFIEMMGFYEESYVKFDHEKGTYNPKQVMVVHKSHTVSEEITAVYKWTKHDCVKWNFEG